MSAFTPPDYARVRTVRSFHALRTTPFADGVNALCWPRPLPGDFAAVVALLGDGGGEPLVTLDEADLLALAAHAAARVALDHLLADLRLLRAHALDPALNCIHGYARDETPGPVATDVFSFHADRAPIAADTWLCTYHGPATEGLRNEEAQRRIDHPPTRAALLQTYGGADDAGFRAHLAEHSYDLHYAPLPGARPYDFGLGNLWRIAVESPGSPVPPCIHRAPATRPGQPPRLLLIS